MNLRIAWCTWKVPGHPGLHSETLFKKKGEKEERKERGRRKDDEEKKEGKKEEGVIEGSYRPWEKRIKVKVRGGGRKEMRREGRGRVRKRKN